MLLIHLFPNSISFSSAAISTTPGISSDFDHQLQLALSFPRCPSSALCFFWPFLFLHTPPTFYTLSLFPSLSSQPPLLSFRFFSSGSFPLFLPLSIYHASQGAPGLLCQWKAQSHHCTGVVSRHFTLQKPNPHTHTQTDSHFPPLSGFRHLTHRFTVYLQYISMWCSEKTRARVTAYPKLVETGETCNHDMEKTMEGCGGRGDEEQREIK